MQNEPASFIRGFYDALNRRDYDGVRKVLADRLVHHGTPNGNGPEPFLRALREYHAAFPDLSHSIEDVITGADRVVVRTRTTGTHSGPFLGHQASGLTFSAEALSVYRMEPGAIHEIWEVFDTIEMLQQLGLYARVAARAAVSQQLTPEEAPSQTPRPIRVSSRTIPGPASEIPLAEIRSDPLRFLKRMATQYGDLVRYVCDGRDTVLVNNPDAIRHVLHTREANYSKLGTPDLLLLKPMLGEGLLTTVGPVWREDRHLIQPRLSRQRMETSAGMIVEVVDEMLTRWLARPDLSEPLDVVSEMSRLTLEIAARLLFSTRLGAQSERFGAAMEVLNESLGRAHQGRPLGTDKALQDALSLIRQTVWQAILARRFYDPGDDDLLAALLEAQRKRGDSHKRLIDQAVTILLAGHETTAKALSWGFALLDTHADTAALLREELRLGLGDRRPTVQDLSSLPYTRAVIDEALRLRPPVWMLTRTALEADTIAGYEIPPGALVAISPYLIHRHPRLWADPDRFWPERFIDGDGDGATAEYRYIPFGHGSRYCVGKFFAMLEMPLVLARICSRVSLAIVPDHRVEADALVTMRPRGGLPMIVTTRSADGMA